ncbi:hypothetical protein BANRA_02943 [Klebsiella pneumoniae]|nr:hypothetical protein BANRA_02943 [Klebsiella pneumoniae]
MQRLELKEKLTAEERRKVLCVAREQIRSQRKAEQIKMKEIKKGLKQSLNGKTSVISSLKHPFINDDIIIFIRGNTWEIENKNLKESEFIRYIETHPVFQSLYVRSMGFLLYH